MPKKKYKILNWSEYNNSLKNRGDVTIWFTDSGVNTWCEPESPTKDIGRHKQYSDEAIKTMCVFRQVFHLRLRQTEGFTKSILKLMKIDLPIPDYTTVSRRSRDLEIDFVTSKPEGKINIIFDSSGIKVVGEKEWINYKYGLRQRKIWRKLHIGITDDGNIIARESDIATVPNLLSQINNTVDEVLGDGAYFRKRMLKYIAQNQSTKEARFIGPPQNKGKSYGKRLRVEATFSRYKRIIGNKFKAQHFLGQQTEAKLSLLILNKMRDIGMPLGAYVA